MLKKIAVIGAAGLLTAAVLTQTKVGSYICHQFDRADKYLESKIPPEEEVRQLKKDVAALDQDIDQAKGAVATARVDAKAAKGELDDARARLDRSRSAVEARGKMMKEASAGKTVKWDGRDISFDRAKELLQNQVTAHKNLEKEVKAQETMLAVKERTRDLTEQHLQALVSQKTELQAAVVELEADVQRAKIEQVESKYQNDGTRMADVKERLAGVRHRIEVQREKLALARQYDKSGVADKSVDEILAELDAKGEKADQVSRK